ncbi:expressed unknown protein [Seminavis robusta]|uniref:Uncharacterized protein n=1 Tax=Seminavis robusta TaxID=568900 RepID=A0A9N8HGM6_9STRA|nr:expressed unknown protein [Seminavis robusta]|eukprot:Sro646_g180710.1 n/a (544) ;mRNA; r:16002-17633
MPASTTVADLKTAKKNKYVQLSLVIGDDSDVSSLTTQLQTSFANDHNNDECHLCNIVLVDGHEEQSRDWSAPDIGLLLDVIGNLDSVVHLGFENLGSAGTTEENDTPLSTFPVTRITTLLQRTKRRLETLVFDGCNLTGTHQEQHDALAAAMEECVCIRSCVITNNFDLYLPSDDSDEPEAHPIDKMVEAIAKLPLLIEADLVTYSWYEEGYPYQFQSSDPLKGLFLECPNLQELVLGEFNLSNEGLKDVGRCLAKCTSLRKLELHLAPSTRTRACVQSLTLLANALSANTTLEVFKMEFDERCPNLDTFLVKVAEALEQNAESALVKFKVTSPIGYGQPVETAFCKLLQSNYTLQKVDFLTLDQRGEEDEEEGEYQCLDASKRTEMDLYLRLNCRGRKELLTTATSRGKWMTAFGKFSHDLDAIHYYVRRNPWLCHADRDPELLDTKQNPKPTTMTTGTEGATNAAMMASLQQLIATGFQNTQLEIRKLNGKMDDMHRQHAREKRHLEEEVRLLKEQLANLKLGMANQEEEISVPPSAAPGS